ncbi:MAG: hypothetical protein AAF423_06630 [Pseudomonadota bacterium]
MTDACDNMEVIVQNTNVTYSDGDPAPIIITAAGPTERTDSYGNDEGVGGTLTDKDGNTPPKLPITVNNGDSYTFTASSSDGSHGWTNGQITVQCNYASSSSSQGQIQLLTMNYSGQPDSLDHAANCTGSGTNTVQSQNFTANGSATKGKAGDCQVIFSVMSGGTAGTDQS